MLLRARSERNAILLDLGYFIQVPNTPKAILFLPRPYFKSLNSLHSLEQPGFPVSGVSFTALCLTGSPPTVPCACSQMPTMPTSHFARNALLPHTYMANSLTSFEPKLKYYPDLPI